MKLRIKRLIAVLLIATQVVVSLAGCGMGDGGLFGALKGDATVSFALPEDASLFEKEETTLPESMKVPKGTLISQLPDSVCTSNVFVGYSYDPQGQQMAGDMDAIEKDLTLYPRFETAEGMTNVFDMNFVSGTDVDTDYSIELAACGLSADEIKELITLKDLSLVEEVPYEVEEKESILPADLGIPEKMAPYVKNMIETNHMTPETDLASGLTAMGLDSEAIYRIVLIYAPEERLSFLQDQVDPAGGDRLSDAAELELLGIGNRTENELKAAYGLDEDDSLERYWR
jgi:hypothetical protein